jgi:hypothetical protein
MSIIIDPFTLHNLSPSSTLDRAVAYWHAEGYNSTLNYYTDLSGNSLHALPSSAGTTPVTGLTAPKRFYHPGANYLYFPGTASNNLSVPRPAATTYWRAEFHGWPEVLGSDTVDPIVFGNTSTDFAEKRLTRLRLYSDAGRTTVVGDFQAANSSEPHTGYTDSYTRVWTINRSTTGLKMSLVDRTVVLLGADKYLQVADSSFFNIGVSDSFTVVFVGRRYASAANGENFIAKRAIAKDATNTANSFGWNVFTDGGLDYGAAIHDGTNLGGTDTLMSVTEGNMVGAAVRFTRNTGVTNVLNQSGTVEATGTYPLVTGALTTTQPLRIGRGPGSDSHANIEWLASAFFAETLTSAEITNVCNDLLETTANGYTAPISFIGSAGGTDSATVPTHQAGDLIIVSAFINASASVPRYPDESGWSPIHCFTGSSASFMIAYKFAASSSEVTGTWSNAGEMIVAVYRNVDAISPVGSSARTNAISTTVTYPALTMHNSTGTSWVVGIAGHRSLNTALETAPTGMINRIVQNSGSAEIAHHDTNNTVSSWSSTNVSVGGTSSNWTGITYELMGGFQPGYIPITDSISFVGAAGGTTSATIPTHQPGDLIVIYAWRSDSTSIPTLPAGWRTIDNRGANTTAFYLAYKIATTNSETTGTWTNATGVQVGVWRGVDLVTPIGSVTQVGDTSNNNINYKNHYFTNTVGGSWYAAFVSHPNPDILIENSAPTGMVHRAHSEGASGGIALHDTNGGVTSWSAQTVSLGGTVGGRWTVSSFEIRPAWRRP